MKIGIAQLNSTNSVEKNYNQIRDLLESLRQSENMPELVIFPENSLFFRIDEGEAVQALSLDSELWAGLQKLAADLQIDLMLTTAVNHAGHITNSIVFVSSEQSSPEVLYSKIHLFDIHLQGQKPIKESDVFSFGQSPKVFQYKGIKIGLSICYDIRFSELYKKYGEQEVDLIVIPAAFLVKTGQAHWHILNRARAIENQCFVIAPAQAGIHQSVHSEQKRETYGHSLGIDPWGHVICDLDRGVDLRVIDIDVQQNILVRQQIPMKNHRRL